MSDVIYRKGLTCECDSSIPRLTIEGRKVPVEIVDGLFHSAEPPNEKTKTLRELAEKVVDHSPELNSREAAKEKHLAILKKGVKQWNKWRRSHPEIRPILYDTNLSSGASKRRDLSCVNFANAVLVNANLSWAKLSGANFHEANLGEADLSWADLTEANFCRTDLYRTNLFHADLTNANLQGTQLAGTIFEEATLKNCTIYGLSAWDLRLNGARQEDLIVLYRKEKTAPAGEPEESKIIMPDLRSAQFIYLLLHNENVHAAFNALTSKVVLILGRFGGGGLELLRSLGEGLREGGYLPMIFEFARPQDRTYTETVRTLAGLARFVVVDLSGPSVPQELAATVPHLQIPFVPILEKGKQTNSMFDDFLVYEWVLKPVVEFESTADLLLMLPDKIISPAEKRVEIRQAKLREIFG